MTRGGDPVAWPPRPTSPATGGRPAARREPGSAPRPAPAHDTGGGWFESSHDLLKGSDVIDDPAALDDDLIDALFPPTPPKPAR